MPTDQPQTTTEPETKWRRVSSSMLPLLAAHPAALAFGSESKIADYSTEPLALGSAFGEAMSLAARSGRDAVNVVDMARRYGVPAEELLELWRRFAWDPRGFQPEVQMELRRMATHGRYGIVISVRADLATTIGAHEYEVVELKSERDVARAYDAREHLQLLAQMVALWETTGRNDGTGHVAYVRKGRRAWSSVELVGDEQHEHVADTLFEVAQAALDQCDLEPDGRDCRVGAGCVPFCRGRDVCHFYQDAIRDTLVPIGAGGKIVLTPETLPQIMALRKAAASFIEATKAPVVDWLERWGSPVPEPGTTKVWVVRDGHTTPAAGIAEVRAALVARGWEAPAIEEFIAEVNKQRRTVTYRQAALVSQKATPAQLEDEFRVRDAE